MRVIEQLILHFWERGELSREQIDRLIAMGYIRSDQLDGYWPEFKDQMVDQDDEDDEEEFLARLVDAIEEELIAQSSDKPRGLRIPGRRWGRRPRRS